jgi:hypothetical protein
MVQVRLAFSSIQIVTAQPPALVPFVRSLPAQAGFHPKRNQAREKLATLPSSRFQDLTSDLRHELGRRYPACNEVVIIISPFLFPLFHHFRRPPLLAQLMTTYLSPVSPMSLPDAIEIRSLGAPPGTIQIAGRLSRRLRSRCCRGAKA